MDRFYRTERYYAVFTKLYTKDLQNTTYHKSLTC